MRSTDNRDLLEVERFDKARIEALLQRVKELERQLERLRKGEN